MKQLLISLFLLSAANTLNAANVVDNYVDNAQLVGEGRLTYMFWDVYDASLIAPNGVWKRDKPFALKLNYLRKIDGKKIAERSVEEMRNLGINDEVKLATWHSQMRKIFPDVDDGKSLIGIRDHDGNAIFYSNDQQIGRIDDVEFSNAFFDIWLNDKTTSPKLRRKLLGRK